MSKTEERRVELCFNIFENFLQIIILINMNRQNLMLFLLRDEQPRQKFNRIDTLVKILSKERVFTKFSLLS